MEDSDRQKWEGVWLREATEVCEILPGPLVGDAPITVLLYQPDGTDGSVIYMDRKTVAESQIPNPLPLRAGDKIKSVLKSANHLASWTPMKGEVEIDSIRAFIERTEAKRRQEYVDAEGRRYEDLKIADAGHLEPGLPFRIIPIFPSPLHHRDRRWWRDLPLLGACYTYGTRLEKHLEVPEEPEANRSLADSLMLICAINAGNRILHSRLQNLLCKKPYSVLSIVRKLCQVGWKKESVLERNDQMAFLATNLLLAHGFFFSNRTGMRMLSHLGRNPREVFDEHGWVYPGDHESETEVAVPQELDDLSKHFVYLIHAAVRWEDADNSSKRPSAEKVNKEVRNALCTGLTLLCGIPVLVRVLDRKAGVAETAELTTKTLRESQWEYLSIRPPDRLLIQDSEVIIPGIPVGRLKNSLRSKRQLGIASAVLRALSPALESPSQKWYVPGGVSISFTPGAAMVDGENHRYPWMEKYVRARCVFRSQSRKAKRTGPARP